MKDNNNTILVTGGATGIGLALAVRFLKKRNEVIICGRRQEKLDEAKRKYPGQRFLCKTLRVARLLRPLRPRIPI